MTKKTIIDQSTFLEDMSKNIIPKYLNIPVSDSLTSNFGVLASTLATSIDDTYKLMLARSTDSILELSDNIIKLRMGASIANMDTVRTTPAFTMATLMIAVSDILEKGVIQANGDIFFTIDKRSEIIHDTTPFSIPDSLIIRAIKSNVTGYFFTVDYAEMEQTAYPLSIQQTIHDGIEKLQITLMVYQYKINSAQRNVMDTLAFSTEGIRFDYDNKLVGFDVYYKTSSIDNFKKVNLKYYIVDTLDDSSLRFNDDKDNEIYILNNYNLSIPENSVIRVDIKESLGTDGMITLGQRSTEFILYQGDDYGMLTVNVEVILLMDPVGASEADGVVDIRKKIIRKKFEREAIITTQDIKNFIETDFPNTQLLARRNDYKSKEMSIYTLININGEVAPATTLDLKIFQDEFDVVHSISGRRILKSNSAYKMTDISTSTVSKIPIPSAGEMATLEANKDVMCLAFPFVLAVTTDPICKFFMNTINETITTQSLYQNENSILKYAVRDIKFERNSMSTNYDKYNITVNLLPNSIGDSNLVNEEGVIDHTQLKTYIIFKSDGTRKAYLPLTISSVDVIKNIVTLTGSFSTDDFITEDLKLKIVSDMILVGESNPSELVIDYLNSEFEIVSFAKATPANTSNEYYSIIPGMETYTITNSSYNKTTKLNLLIDLNEFMNCNITVFQEEVQGVMKTGYIIKEVPFIKYSYCKTNILSILTNMSNLKTLYVNLGAKLVGKTIDLKFIRTYGRSKYIKIGTAGSDLANINPIIKFRIYGEVTSQQEIRNFVEEYFNSINDMDKGLIYLSNVCREIENNFGVDSCICTGIDGFTEVNPVIKYEKPNRETTPELYAVFIPEYLCLNNIDIITDSNTMQS